MAPKRLTIVFLRDMLIAPLASEEFMMTGSISGMMPTAIVMPNMRDSSQLPMPFVMKFAIKMTGTVTSMKRIRSLLTLSRFFSNALFSSYELRLLAMLPK